MLDMMFLKVFVFDGQQVFGRAPTGEDRGTVVVIVDATVR
jgi:hypothetical protein